MTFYIAFFFVLLIVIVLLVKGGAHDKLSEKTENFIDKKLKDKSEEETDKQ